MPDNQTTAALLADLAAWSDETGGFHGDRQLADRVLLATKWRCLPDPEDPTKAIWEFGTNPVYTCWEPHVPHPIQSLDAAIGQFPIGWRVCSMSQVDRDSEWKVTAVRDGAAAGGEHLELSVAVSIAAVKAWDIERERRG